MYKKIESMGFLEAKLDYNSPCKKCFIMIGFVILDLSVYDCLCFATY